MEKITASSGNVFADLGFDTAEAASLQLCSRLMVELKSIIEESGMTQVQVASKLGIHQSRISDLMCGKIGRFSVDILVNLLARVGSSGKNSRIRKTKQDSTFAGKRVGFICQQG